VDETSAYVIIGITQINYEKRSQNWKRSNVSNS